MFPSRMVKTVQLAESVWTPLSRARPPYRSAANTVTPPASISSTSSIQNPSNMSIQSWSHARTPSLP
jgi:hypothetical protein